MTSGLHCTFGFQYKVIMGTFKDNNESQPKDEPSNWTKINETSIHMRHHIKLEGLNLKCLSNSLKIQEWPCFSWTYQRNIFWGVHYLTCWCCSVNQSNLWCFFSINTSFIFFRITGKKIYIQESKTIVYSDMGMNLKCIMTAQKTHLKAGNVGFTGPMAPAAPWAVETIGLKSAPTGVDELVVACK